jgi:hypothetical protein
VRYAYCRRQFANIKGSKEERRLIDYQTHMAVLGPNISHVFVIVMISNELEKLTKISNK